MVEKGRELYTLHRYFIWANRMRMAMQDCIAEQGPPPEEWGAKKLHWLLLPTMYQGYWLATLFVLVEGWQSLKLSDPDLDILLANKDKVALLRRFRNGVFHYQPKYFDDRTTGFLEVGCNEWAERLHRAFSEMFKAYYHARGSRHEVAELDDGSLELRLWNEADGPPQDG